MLNRHFKYQIFAILAFSLIAAVITSFFISTGPRVIFIPGEDAQSSEVRSLSKDGTDDSSEDGSARREAPSQSSGDVRVVRMMVAKEALELFQGGQAQFIDARLEKDYRTGHVPGAVNVSPSDFTGGWPEELDLMLPEFITIIYCSSQECDSSKLVAKQLIFSGFQDLQIIEGGFPAWENARGPVESGSVVP